MQYTATDIYKKVAEDNDIPFDVIKNIGNKVFDDWKSWVRKPTTVLLGIRGVGRMYLRKNRIQKFIGILNTHKNMEEETYLNKGDIDGLIKTFEDRWIEYEQLVKEWKECKAPRALNAIIPNKIEKTEETHYTL